MYATASSHLPHPCSRLVEVVLGDADPRGWFPELERLDDRPLAELGARSRLARIGPFDADAIELTTTRVVRSTVTMTGATPGGRRVELCLSLSPWDGGTAVVVSLDDGGPERALHSWAASRRLESALVRLAGHVAGLLSPAGRARP